MSALDCRYVEVLAAYADSGTSLPDPQAATISQLQAEIARYREALRSAETALASEYEIRGEFDTTYPLPVGPILSVVRSALGPISPRKFSLGHRVRKVKGSSWQGHVVGFYSTQMTPIGYCIESEREPGSVQLYPEAALEAIAPATLKSLEVREP